MGVILPRAESLPKSRRSTTRPPEGPRDRLGSSTSICCWSSTTSCWRSSPSVDLIDVSGPNEVFLTANRLAQRRGDAAPFDLVTTTADGDGVTAHGGLRLVPQTAVTDLGPVDVPIMRGRHRHRRPTGDSLLTRTARDYADRGAVVMSICTGAFVLGAAGLLDGRPFTTHFEDAAELAQRLGSADADDAVRWVDPADIITAGGMTSGIAAALHLVERTAGRDLAVATANQVDYVWTHNRVT